MEYDNNTPVSLPKKSFVYVKGSTTKLLRFYFPKKIRVFAKWYQGGAPVFGSCATICNIRIIMSSISTKTVKVVDSK